MLLVEGVIRALNAHSVSAEVSVPVRHSHGRLVIFLHHDTPVAWTVIARL
jgi:hypothetical protein